MQTYDFFVDYSFEANDGETYVGTTELSVSEYGMFNEGGDVLVVYSPLNPTNNRIDDSRFVPLLFCSYLPVLLMIWLTLMYGWRLIAGEVKRPEPIPRLDTLQANKE